MKFILSLVAFLMLTESVVLAGKYVVCYYGTWASYRTGAGKFTVDNIDPTLCTHLNYAFFGINTDGSIRILDAYLDLPDNFGRNAIGQLNSLKQANPSLKTIAAIGGWNAGSAPFSAVAKSASLRANFATQARIFCQRYGFDGIDLDWEYPAQRDGDPSVDKANFVLMLQSLYGELKKYGLLLTVAVGASESSAAQSYDIAKVAANVDFINLMEYDFHGSWESATGHNAPLNEVQASVRYWLSQGAPASKLVLGIPQYGRTWTLANPAQSGVGAATAGPGMAGPYTREGGYLGYNEICEKLQGGGWTTAWDSERSAAYAYSGNQWVGYDSVQSINLKCNFIKSNGLAGGMFWSIETDDFLGKCGPKFTLTAALKSCLGGSDSMVSTNFGQSGNTDTIIRTTTTTTTTTQRSPVAPVAVSVDTSGEVVCTTTGYFRDPVNCNKFYHCVGTTRYENMCPAGLYFSTTSLTCDWPHNVKCP